MEAQDYGGTLELLTFKKIICFFIKIIATRHIEIYFWLLFISNMLFLVEKILNPKENSDIFI